MGPFYENKADQLYIDRADNLSFPAHLHNLLEMLYVTQGEITVRVGEKSAALTQGEAAVIFPNCVHSYESAQSRCVLLLFPASILGRAIPLVHETRPGCPFVYARQITKAMRDGFLELESLRGQSAPYLPEALAQLVFVRVLATLTLVPAETRDTQNLAARAIDYISRNYTEGMRQSALAKQLNVSKSHLSRVLKTTLNMNFCEYVNCLRVENAKNLLQTTQLSILEVAIDSGFESLRSFNRAFHAVTGQEPRVYRAESGLSFSR